MATTEEEYYRTLSQWQELVVSIKHLSDQEKVLREALFKGAFPKPEEGVNTMEMPNGGKLKGTFKLNRTVLQDKVREIKIDLDTWNKVFRQKIELNTAAYRTLDEKLRKLVDKALEIKPGLPSLELVPPKPTAPDIAP